MVYGSHHNLGINGCMVYIIEGKGHLQLIIFLRSVLPVWDEAYPSHGYIFYGDVPTFPFYVIYASSI